MMPESAAAGRVRRSASSGADSIHLVVSAQSQQQDGLAPLVLHILEYDAQVVARAARPIAYQRPTQLMSP